jgi:hypothetical protein
MQCLQTSMPESVFGLHIPAGRCFQDSLSHGVGGRSGSAGPETVRLRLCSAAHAHVLVIGPRKGGIQVLLHRLLVTLCIGKSGIQIV